jgi:CHAD domain-containing protein
MSYQLETGESAGGGLHRIVREEIDLARDGLASDEVARNESVHETRKGFKKIRAVLRLVRHRLAGDLYDRENTWYRDAGRTLSLARDAQVLVETAEALGADEVAGALAARRDRLLGESDLDERVLVLVDALVERRERLADWPLDVRDPEDFESGIAGIYRRGQRALDAVSTEVTDEAVHAWRKRVKDLWYVGRILEPVWPAGLGGWVLALDHLSTLLGEHNDLAVLVAELAETREGGPLVDPGTAAEVTLQARRRQGEIRAEALPLGRRLYAETPEAHARRMVTYWRVWTEEGEPSETTTDP